MRMLVLGGGISGLGAVRLAGRLGHDVAVYDRDPEVLAGLPGIDTFGGDWQSDWLNGFDLVVTSPGLPQHSAPITAALAAGLEVWGELEFAARNLTAPIIAVTGTNGKTTVTTLITDMLSASGLRATAAGNIGTALTDLVGSTPDVIVVEASSFQLRFIEEFAPNVAVLLNIAPDHLDWHQTFENYRDAKANLLKNAGPDVPTSSMLTMPRPAGWPPGVRHSLFRSAARAALPVGGELMVLISSSMVSNCLWTKFRSPIRPFSSISPPPEQPPSSPVQTPKRSARSSGPLSPSATGERSMEPGAT